MPSARRCKARSPNAQRNPKHEARSEVENGPGGAAECSHGCFAPPGAKPIVRRSSTGCASVGFAAPPLHSWLHPDARGVGNWKPARHHAAVPHPETMKMVGGECVSSFSGCLGSRAFACPHLEGSWGRAESGSTPATPSLQIFEVASGVDAVELEFAAFVTKPKNKKSRSARPYWQASQLVRSAMRPPRIGREAI